MIPLDAKRDALLAGLRAIPDAHARLERLMDLARAAPPLPESLRTEAHRVEGCMANLWVAAEFRDGVCRFRCDSDSLVVKSVAGLLCDFYSGATPREILSIDPSFLKEAGITQHLSANRRNALTRVWESIRRWAEEHLE